jgi:hypothetical protein
VAAHASPGSTEAGAVTGFNVPIVDFGITLSLDRLDRRFKKTTASRANKDALRGDTASKGVIT